MANVTFALLGADRHRVKYLVTADGAATGNLDASSGVTPDLVTDTAAGSPIRALVTTAVASQAAARTLMRGQTVTYRFGPGGTAGRDWIIDFNWDAANHLRVTCTIAVGADAIGTVLEIESVHSQIR
jgi:hypothetical protein